MTRQLASVVFALVAGLAGVCVAPSALAHGNAPAASECAARIDRIGLRTDAGYAPFSAAPSEWPLEIGVEGDAGCRLTLAFRSGQGGHLRGAAEPLQYVLRDDEGRSLATDAAARLRVRGAGAGGTTRLVVSLPPGQAVPAGRYGDRLLVQLLDADRVVDERDFELVVHVESQASLSLGGSATMGFSKTFGAGLDFGELATGKEREAYLFVLSNAAYALRFTSANRGSLRHVTEGSTVGSVPYVARLDGSPLDLTRTATVEGRASRRILTLPPYRLNVQIGDVAGRPAGQYRDVITVDLVILD